MALTLAQSIENTIANIANGGFMDDLSDAGIKLMIQQADPKATFDFQPSLIPAEHGQWLVTFSDSSTFTFDKYDNDVEPENVKP